MVSRFRLMLAGVALVVSLTGCGGGEALPELGQVTGTVTLNGQPLEKVHVTFQPQSGKYSQATTDAEGKYTLVYGDFADGIKGAAIGSHSVTIVQGDPANVPDNEKLPARYNLDSQLTGDVQSGENTIDFALTKP